MMTIEVLEQLAEDAKKYARGAQASLARNNHMNELGSRPCKDLTPGEVELDTPSQAQIDAVLVDFINFVGMQRAVDYAMYTKDLRT